MRIASLLACAALALFAVAPASPTTVLFIGNSFTFGAGSPVQKWRPEIVTDLNHEGIGGVPALFKSFTRQAGLDYDVSLETHPGVGLDWHLQTKHDVLVSRPWDVVVMHGYSTLDAVRPGDPATLVSTTKQMAELLVSVNPKVEIHLTATWPRADQTYPGDRSLAWPADRCDGARRPRGVRQGQGNLASDQVGDSGRRRVDARLRHRRGGSESVRRHHTGTDRSLDEGSLPRERGGVLPRGAHGVRRSHGSRSASARRRRVFGVRARDVRCRSEGSSTGRVRSTVGGEAAEGRDDDRLGRRGTVRRERDAAKSLPARRRPLHMPLVAPFGGRLRMR